MKNLFKVFVMLVVVVAFAACESNTKTNNEAAPENDATEQVDQNNVEPDAVPEGDATEEGAEATTDEAQTEEATDAAETTDAPEATEEITE